MVLIDTLDGDFVERQGECKVCSVASSLFRPRWHVPTEARRRAKFIVESTLEICVQPVAKFIVE